ncbi:MFS general substrate transporter [Meredithblackwellia eburnea MCA 4105]
MASERRARATNTITPTGPPALGASVDTIAASDDARADPSLSRGELALGLDSEKRDRRVDDEADAVVVDTYPDGGWDAWMSVFCSFVLCATVNGYGLVFGVLVQDLHQNVHKNVPLSTLNFSGGVANFMFCSVGFVSGRMGEKYGFRRVIAVGVVVQYVAYIVASFTSQSLVCLFIIQGFLLGFGQGIGVPLFMSLPSRYFLRKRGTASAIAGSGHGFGGSIASLIVRGLLPRLGYGHTLLVYGSINFALSMAAVWYMKERQLESAKGKPRVDKNWLPVGVWRDPAIYSLLGATIVAIMGYLTPFIFLTPYTTAKCPQLDPNSILPAVPLIVGAFISGIGRVLSGVVSDSIGPLNAIILSWVLGGLFQILIWANFANSFANIMAFAVLYGMVASWFLAQLPYACSMLWGMRGLATITGLGVLATGPGTFAGAPLGGLILQHTGGNYKAVAYFSGGCMWAGGAILLIARFNREKRLLKRF